MLPVEEQDFLEIDPLALDTAWLKQPGKYASVARMLAEARAELDACKNAMTVVEAEVAQKVRTNPTRYNIDKVTEKAVSDAVLVHSRMKQAQKEFFEAKHEVDLLAGLLQALEHRKDALNAITKLWLAEYFGSGPGSVRASDAREIADATRGDRRRVGQTSDIPKKKRKEDG